MEPLSFSTPETLDCSSTPGVTVLTLITGVFPPGSLEQVGKVVRFYYVLPRCTLRLPPGSTLDDRVTGT